MNIEGYSIQEQQQLSFLDSIMLDELSKFLTTEGIIHYKGDKMVLFETNTFARAVHRIEVDTDSYDDYILTLSQGKGKEKKIVFDNAADLVSYVRVLQN